MTPTPVTVEIEVEGTWTSQTLTNALGRFPTGVSSDWGKLRWDEVAEGANSVTVDIMDSDTDEVLASGLTHSVQGIDLTAFTAIGSKNLKIKFYLRSVE